MKGQLNKRIAAIPPSLTLGVTSKAKQMKADGIDTVNFAAGEPDFDTPEVVKRAAIEALERGETKYSPVPGVPALRAAIAEKLNEDNGLPYRPDQVVLSNGAKHSVFNVMMALCREGEDVIIPSPYWLSYPEMVKIAGGKPLFLRTREADNFKVRPEALEKIITPRTKAIILNSPSNPTGAVYTRAELEAICEIAVRHGIYIVADEIYETLVYSGETHHSVGSFGQDVFDLTVTINGFSKSCAMTGWRLGYLAGPTPIVKAISALQSHSTSGPNTFAQYGAIAALKHTAEARAEMGKAFEARRDLVYERLTAMPKVSCPKPGGAFYAFPNISQYGLNSVAFTEKLIAEQAVAAVPGAAFGADEHIRISYACGTDELTRGLDRLEAFLKTL